MYRVALTTLGCKANWADTEAMRQALVRAGFAVVPFDAEAEAYVVNTCTVTSLASAQSRQLLRRARRRSPAACVVATGCGGEVDPGALREGASVDAVFGTSDRAALLDYLCARGGQGGAANAAAPSPFAVVPAGPQSRIRAFLKIQDGCSRRCAYCIIPRARGAARSMPPEDVVRAAAGLSRHHREILLAGIDIGQYGEDLKDGTDLMGLLARLASVEGMARLRVSSLSPRAIDERLLTLLGQGGICRHLHLSIQSACDAVLLRMGRGYAASEVARAVQRLVERVPQVAVTGDVIAGFPGETEGEHRETLALLAGLPIAGLHVFPFSARRGTAAAAMPGQVSRAVRTRRAAELRSMSMEARRRYLRGLIGSAFDVIVISRSTASKGMVTAVADTGVAMEIPASALVPGDMVRATVTGLQGVDVDLNRDLNLNLRVTGLCD
jgi:threonylcarbamoyladenosine tRNA methylthiotransferase MtaB